MIAFTGLPTVYPRVCGGTSRIRRKAATIAGLSPRVRGNRGGIPDGTGDSGSIPACAGEPMVYEAACLQYRVYPRVCGGTILSPAIRQRRMGLSPRVRGNHIHPRLSLFNIGSIPACAGEP